MTEISKIFDSSIVDSAKRCHKMNIKEELILKILSSIDIIQGKTKFVKILHFSCKLLEENKIESPFKFRPDNFGAYSPDVKYVLKELQSCRYVKCVSHASSKRIDLSLLNKNYEFQNNSIVEMGPKIELLVKTLNPYSADEIIAFSYDSFPDMAVNSQIKPKINRKIDELFSISNPDFKDSVGKNPLSNPVSSEIKTSSPQFNDLDVRTSMMRSLGLKELPSIIPDSIDDSSGIIANETSFLKKYDFEKMLGDVRRR